MTFLPCSISCSRLSLAVRRRRIRQLALDRPVALEIRDRRRIRDERGEERPPERRLAEHPRRDARTRLVERRVVVHHLLPVRQLAIGAGLEAERRFEVWKPGRRRDLLGGERRNGGEGAERCEEAEKTEGRGHVGL